MTKEELLEKLSDIEWGDFEVKLAATAVPKSSWETVSAFSNTSGGWLVFGIRQAGKRFLVEGTQNPEKIEQDFITTLRSEKFNIKIRPDFNKYNIDGKTVLAFYIPLSDKKPIYFGSPVNTYIRTGSGDQKATKEEIDSMYRDQAFGTRSSKTVVQVIPSALRSHAIEQYRDYMRRFNPTHAYNRLTEEELLTKLQIISQKQLTYAGLLFFGKNQAIQQVFPDFRIDLIEIPGTSYSNAQQRYTYRLDEQENLWSYYFAVFDRLRQKIKLPFKMGSEGFAIENYPYLEALREALVNLLMHTDYFSPARPRIRIFDDRLEFANPGGLPVPLEKLLETDTSIPRNPILARTFRAVKLAENAGYGFDKMISGWKSYEGNEPVFQTEIDQTIVTFPLAVEEARKEPADGGTKGGIKGGTKGSIKAMLTERQFEVYSMIEDDNTVSIDKVTTHMGINRSAVQKHFDALKQKGVITRKEGKSGGYWEILIKT